MTEKRVAKIGLKKCVRLGFWWGGTAVVAFWEGMGWALWRAGVAFAPPWWDGCGVVASWWGRHGAAVAAQSGCLCAAIAMRFLDGWMGNVVKC